VDVASDGLSLQRTEERTPPSLIHRGEVSEDSDRPVESCRPVPTDEADDLAAGFPEPTPRSGPAHEGAPLVPLGTAEPCGVRWQLVSDTLHGWAAEHQRQPRDLGVRVTWLASPLPSPPLAVRSSTSPSHRETRSPRRLFTSPLVQDRVVADTVFYRR
jgi:hypothetical protein